MSDRAETLAEIINAAVQGGARDTYTCIPAKVVKWDATKQRANCQILVKNVTEAEDGSREVVSWPVVPGVPVQFIGAGGFRITCPISDGGTTAATTGTLFFSHRSLDKWLTGSGGEVDPEFDHDHALTDCIFMPGLMTFGAPWQRMPTAGMTIGSDTSNAWIAFDDQAVQIKLGGDAATDFMMMGTTFKAALDTLVAALSTFVAAVIPVTGAPAPAIAAMTTAISAFQALAPQFLSKLSKTG